MKRFFFTLLVLFSTYGFSQTKAEQFVGVYARSGGMFAAESYYQMTIKLEGDCLSYYEEEKFAEMEEMDEYEEEEFGSPADSTPKEIVWIKLDCKMEEAYGVMKLILQDNSEKGYGEKIEAFEMDEEGNVAYFEFKGWQYNRTRAED